MKKLLIALFAAAAFTVSAQTARSGSWAIEFPKDGKAINVSQTFTPFFKIENEERVIDMRLNERDMSNAKHWLAVDVVFSTNEPKSSTAQWQKWLAPQALDGEPLTPLELADEGYAVEDLAVQIPEDHQRAIAVVEELHVVDEGEGVVLHDVGEVGLGHDEQGEGHLVPLVAALKITVNLTPRLHPETLVDGGLGEVVGVVLFLFVH